MLVKLATRNLEFIFTSDATATVLHPSRKPTPEHYIYTIAIMIILIHIYNHYNVVEDHPGGCCVYWAV